MVFAIMGGIFVAGFGFRRFSAGGGGEGEGWCGFALVLIAFLLLGGV